MPIYPIIYLDRLEDQEILFRAIWSPTNTYSDIQSFDGAWRQWKRDTRRSGRSDYPCLYSTGQSFSGFNWRHEYLVERAHQNGYRPTNSIRHFIECLKRLQGESSDA